MLKHLLRQEDIVSGQRIPRNMPHDVGFDGAIVYCDQERNLVRFSGAHTPLFYMNDSDLTVIKGDRQSIGYRSSKTSFEYTEHDIISTPFTTFYLTTDGYLDQSGGEKGFPFGKKRFEQMLKAQTHQTLAAQKKTFLQALQTHQKQEAQTDDITVFAFRL